MSSENKLQLIDIQFLQLHHHHHHRPRHHRHHHHHLSAQLECNEFVGTNCFDLIDIQFLKLGCSSRFQIWVAPLIKQKIDRHCNFKCFSLSDDDDDDDGDGDDDDDDDGDGDDDDDDDGGDDDDDDRDDDQATVNWGLYDDNLFSTRKGWW